MASSVLPVSYFKIFAFSEMIPTEQYSELDKYDLGGKNENSVLSHTLKSDLQYFPHKLYSFYVLHFHQFYPALPFNWVSLKHIKIR